MPETLNPAIVKALDKIGFAHERILPWFKPDLKLTILSYTNQAVSFKVEYSPPMMLYPIFKPIPEPVGRLLQVDYKISGTAHDFETLKGTIPIWSTYHTAVTIHRHFCYQPRPANTEWAIVVTAEVDPDREVAERNEANNRDIIVIGNIM